MKNKPRSALDWYNFAYMGDIHDEKPGWTIVDWTIEAIRRAMKQARKTAIRHCMNAINKHAAVKCNCWHVLEEMYEKK